MDSKYFVGIDIASATFVACVIQNPAQVTLAPKEFSNDQDGYEKFRAWLQAQPLTCENTILCMETTGVYGEGLAYFLEAENWWLAVHHALAVKQAFPPTGHKNDAVDSRQIAEFAARFTDKLRRWRPRQALLEQIGALLALREQYVREKTAHQNALRALKRKVVRTPFAEQLHQNSLQQLKANIKALEKEVRGLVEQDNQLHFQFLLLLTIPGVGLLLAANFLVMQANLRDPHNPKAVAAYVGIAPFEHRSGTSVYKKSTSRHYGPATIQLLLGTRSLRVYQPAFRAYFERKTAEGKPPTLILNNMANKLIKIICAVLREQKPYIPNYRSTHPALLNTP